MPPKTILRKNVPPSGGTRKKVNKPKQSLKARLSRSVQLNRSNRMPYPPPPSAIGPPITPETYPAAVFDTPEKYVRSKYIPGGVIFESNMPTFRVGNSVTVSSYPGALQMDATTTTGGTTFGVLPLQVVAWNPLRCQGLAFSGSYTATTYDVAPMNSILANAAQMWSKYRVVGSKIKLHYCSQQATSQMQRYALSLTQDPFQPAIGLGAYVTGSTNGAITLNDIENQANVVAFAPWTSWSKEFQVNGDWCDTYYPSQTTASSGSVAYSALSAPTFRGSCPFSIVAMADAYAASGTRYDGIIFLECTIEFRDPSYMFDNSPIMPRFQRERGPLTITSEDEKKVDARLVVEEPLTPDTPLSQLVPSFPQPGLKIPQELRPSPVIKTKEVKVTK
jgi:hypothetical protein